MGSGIHRCGVTAVWTTSSRSLCIWAVESGRSVTLLATRKWDGIAYPGVVMTLTIMLNMETSSASNDNVSLTPRCLRAAAVSGCSFVSRDSHYCKLKFLTSYVLSNLVHVQGHRYHRNVVPDSLDGAEMGILKDVKKVIFTSHENRALPCTTQLVHTCCCLLG